MSKRQLYSPAQLSKESVQAACRLWRSVDTWVQTEALFASVREKFPSYSYKECLLKSVLVNSLYATNVYALDRMARHLAAILSSSGHPKGRELVVVLAKPLGSRLWHTSFASKFCAVFIDSSVPIYDSVATDVLRTILEKNFHPIASGRGAYASYCANFDRACHVGGVTADPRDVDRYLWLSGSYVRLLNGKNVNTGLQQLLKNPSKGLKQDLSKLLA